MASPARAAALVARAVSAAAAPDPALAALIAPELATGVPSAVETFAARLAARAGGRAGAVLFYGSGLREQALDGMLDFYVLLDRARAWPGSRLAAAANRLLPPNVGYAEERVEGRVLRAKYAVITRAQFERGMAPGSLDTTLWTRFAQPVACVHARSEADRSAVLAAVCRAATTAAYWAAVLGPETGTAAAYWDALFAATYRLELRVESAGRSESLVAHARSRYARLLPVAWRAGGIAFDADGERLRPRLAPRERGHARRRWARRRRLGRPLNVVRLLKAALTFEQPLDYVVWKVERHSGVRLAIAPWERRFPLLAAPGLYCRMRRRGLLR